MSEDDPGWWLPMLPDPRRPTAGYASQSSTAEEHNLRLRWSRLVQGQAALGAVAARTLDGSASESPLRIRVVAAAYAEYLSTSREVSAALAVTPASGAAWTAGLAERMGYLEALQELIHPAGSSAHEDSAELNRLVTESTALVSQTRILLRNLGRESSAAGRAHVALMVAWSRYDEALAELTHAVPEPSGGDLESLAARKNELLVELAAARVLCAQPDGQPPLERPQTRNSPSAVNGGQAGAVVSQTTAADGRGGWGALITRERSA
jgi:hypothetical protein